MVQAMGHGAVEGDRSNMIVVMLTTFDVVQGILELFLFIMHRSFDWIVKKINSKISLSI